LVNAMHDDPREQMVALLPRLRRFAYALTGSIEEGDDVVQSACERALARLHQWQPGTRLDSWMFRIVQTTWIDRVRARKARPELADPDTLERQPANDHGPAVEHRLLLARTRAAMAKLPEDQRAVLALVSVDGLSYKEAASVLGLPIGTVMSRLARARARLYRMVHGEPLAAAGEG
jgi:RNA polymerase sigma-70 factor (ECF subfamily)